MTVMQEEKRYLYIYSFHEDERSLAQLEMRSLFGYDTESTILVSRIKIDPSRSPFIRGRLDVLYFGKTIEELSKLATGVELKGLTFKVQVLENNNLTKNQKIGFDNRRKIEREIGLQIVGKADLKMPDIVFGVIKEIDGWIFGYYHKSKSVWLHHQKKPHNYSTALSTRVARAIVNISVPVINGVRVIDPCSGAGTVIIEALSMGINIVGSDVNPLVTPLARENIAYFGLKGDVLLRDIRNIDGDYDVAIIDLPYNLCSVLPEEEQLEMLRSAREFAKKAVIITIETIDSIIEQAGFVIIDRCIAKKGTFERQIIVCE